MRHNKRRRRNLFVQRLRWAWYLKEWPPKEMAYLLLPSEVVITPERRAWAERIAREHGLLPAE